MDTGIQTDDYFSDAPSVSQKEMQYKNVRYSYSYSVINVA